MQDMIKQSEEREKKYKEMVAFFDEIKRQKCIIEGQLQEKDDYIKELEMDIELYDGREEEYKRQLIERLEEVVNARSQTSVMMNNYNETRRINAEKSATIEQNNIEMEIMRRFIGSLPNEEEPCQGCQLESPIRIKCKTCHQGICYNCVVACRGDCSHCRQRFFI